MCRPIVQEPETVQISARDRLQQKLETAGLQLIVQKTFVVCQVVGETTPVPREESPGSSRRARSENSRFLAADSEPQQVAHMRSNSDSGCFGIEPRATSPKRARAPVGACHDMVVTEDEWPSFQQLPVAREASPLRAAPGIFTAPQSCVKKTTRAKRARGETKERTTLMFKNLPSSYLRPDVMKLLDEAGFASQYNFVHVPVDCFSGSGLGYGFINTTKRDVAELLMSKLQGFSAWNARSTKVLEVCWGEEQGLRPLVARYRNSRMMHPSVPEAYRPMLLSNGQPMQFPTPTKKILKPRCVAASHMKQRSAAPAA